jgi:hypothetical protein
MIYAWLCDKKVTLVRNLENRKVVLMLTDAPNTYSGDTTEWPIKLNVSACSVCKAEGVNKHNKGKELKTHDRLLALREGTHL